MERRVFWWIAIVTILVVLVGGYFIYKNSKTLGVTGGAVFIQTDRGTYELRPGTIIKIDPDGTWVVTSPVEIPTTRGIIIIEEGTELVIEPDPEPGTPDPNGA